MTKRDFLSNTPDIIHHKTWGYAELEIIVDKEGQKGACYRHRDKTTSCGTYGVTWKEVYEKLNKRLVEEGYKD